MKLLLVMSFLLPALTLAAPCEVDGISDSPQKLSCYIHEGKVIQKLALSCGAGTYFITWKSKKHAVDFAYHEDVETGSSPLVFVSSELTLTTVSHRIYSKANLKITDKNLAGICYDK